MDKTFARVPLERLRPYKNNPRKNDKAVDTVAESISQCGYIAPIIVDEGYEVLAGHTRLKALKKLGQPEADILIVSGLTDEQKRKFRILDNRTNELAEWDFDKLTLELNELDFGDFDFGFEFEETDDEPEEKEKFDELRGFENLQRMRFEGEGKYNIPIIAPEERVPSGEFIPSHDLIITKERHDKIVHFFEHDYRFIRYWNEPDKHIDKLRECKAVLSPDFSQYTDMPIALQIYNQYRKHWCACYWQYHGITVIPTISWGLEESFEWCFDGEPHNAPVAVSTVGVMTDPETLRLFLQGYERMKEVLNPTEIIIYGVTPEECKGDNIITFSKYKPTGGKGK